MSESLLYVIAAVVVLGIAAQWLSWRLKLPAIFALLVIGILLGAAVLLGFVDNTAIGGILYWVGASISNGVEIVATWLAETWQAMMGVEESAG